MAEPSPLHQPPCCAWPATSRNTCSSVVWLREYSSTPAVDLGEHVGIMVCVHKREGKHEREQGAVGAPTAGDSQPLTTHCAHAHAQA